jgi:hypothetical protein
LVEAQRKVGAACSLYGEVAHQRRNVLNDLGMARHQEIDDHVDRRATVRCRHLTHELEAPKLRALVIAMFHQRIDERRVFTVPERLRVEPKIDIDRANMRHVLVAAIDGRPGASETSGPRIQEPA